MALYGDYAFAWTITGIAVVRARSQADAQLKFEALSLGTKLNRPGTAFHNVAIQTATPTGKEDER